MDDLRARNPERLEIYDVSRATFVRDALAPTCRVDVLGKETAAKLSNDLQDALSRRERLSNSLRNHRPLSVSSTAALMLSKSQSVRVRCIGYVIVRYPCGHVDRGAVDKPDRPFAA